MKHQNVLVTIQTLVYNHGPYLRKCLDGIVNQKTNFRFEVIVHDDVSNDDSVAIIKEYASRYPEIIRPILEKENQFSKGNGSLNRVMHKATEGKYVALCEGDDYWIDKHKLQKQIDWMENHQDCMMCCTDAEIESENSLNWTRYDKELDIPAKDMIMGGGLWVQTCTTVYRREVYDAYMTLEYCQKCHVGDYCLQVLASVMGKVHYYPEKMGCYRYQTPGSWTTKNHNTRDIAQKIQGWRSEVNMLQGVDVFSKYKYHTYFANRQVEYIWKSAMLYDFATKDILSEFRDVAKYYSPSQKLMTYFSINNMTLLYKIVRKYRRIVHNNV